MAKSFEDQLRKYSGSHPFVLKCKETLLSGKKVPDLQEKICSKVFVTEEKEKKNNKKKELANDSRKLTLERKKEGIKADVGIYANPENQNTKISFSPKDIENFQYLRTPKDWHYDSINFLLERNRAILGDDLGLGKTYSSLIAACESEAKTWLIVVPASLQYNWREEIIKTIPKDFLNVIPLNLIGDNKKKTYELNHINIISYSSLDRIKNDILEKKGLDLLIADEAHNVKTPTSKRTKLFTLISKLAKRCWLLTGTPVSKRPMDLYQLLKISRHKLGDNMINFGMKYCGAKHNGFGWSFLGASKINELIANINNVYLRRNKKDVANLPMKTIQSFSLELDNKARKEHKNLLSNYIAALSKKITSMQQMNIMEARSLVESSLVDRHLSLQKVKDGTLKELCDTFIEQGKKIIIFTQYTETLETSLDLFSKSKFKTCYIRGGMDQEFLEKQKQDFNFDPNTKILVANLTAGSTGHTLIGNTSETGTVTIFLDISNKPFLHKQAEDRSYRIGQEKPVDIFYLLYKDSIEETNYVILQKSFKIMESINELSGMTAQELEQLNESENKLTEKAMEDYNVISIDEWINKLKTI